MPKLDEIGIGPRTIGHALRNQLLAVPINQRSYAWNYRHVTDFYDDIGRAIDEEEPEYFLGSIVVTTDQDGSSSQVVDGQQRLATSVILLSAIRDFFFQNKDTDRTVLVENLLLKKDLGSLEIDARLTLSRSNRDYFLSRVNFQ